MLLKYIFCEFDGEEVRRTHLIYFFNQNKKIKTNDDYLQYQMLY